MDGLSRATTESRARAQSRVLAITAGTGVAALAVTGLLTVGLGGTHSTAATGDATEDAATSTTSTPSTTEESSSGDTATGTVTEGSSAPVATSGGS